MDTRVVVRRVINALQEGIKRIRHKPRLHPYYAIEQNEVCGCLYGVAAVGMMGDAPGASRIRERRDCGDNMCHPSRVFGAGWSSEAKVVLTADVPTSTVQSTVQNLHGRLNAGYIPIGVLLERLNEQGYTVSEAVSFLQDRFLDGERDARIEGSKDVTPTFSPSVEERASDPTAQSGSLFARE